MTKPRANEFQGTTKGGWEQVTTFSSKDKFNVNKVTEEQASRELASNNAFAGLDVDDDAAPKPDPEPQVKANVDTSNAFAGLES